MDQAETNRRFRSGVLWGEEVKELFDFANERNFALPAVNVISSSSVNAVMETAARLHSPVIIQFSYGGAQFFGGKYLLNENHEASIAGAVAGANHVHHLAEYYNVPVILHTDHCARKILPWIDALLRSGEEFYAKTGRPLFSSHMIDLSEESLEENISTCKDYLKKMNKIGMALEIELGVTGGEEDGVDHTEVDNARLYTQPDEVAYAYGELQEISDHFTIAAAFGNVHGVYSPGNVSLKPEILKKSQEYIMEKFNTSENPVNFVFHGGSGSSLKDIREAISNGAVKMNLDTDLQWAYWDGVRNYYEDYKEYLQKQIGNPEGKERPNKKFYDPRIWLREAEESFSNRLEKAFEDLNAVGVNK